MGLTDFRPHLRVLIDGEPLSDFLFGLVTSVSVTDDAGFVSDTAEIEFSNNNPLRRMAMPEPGAEIEISMGYVGRILAMGKFVADEVVERDPPRTISVSCLAKSQSTTGGGFGPIQQQKTRSWRAGLTLQNIAAKIAADNGLTLAITDVARSIVPGHIDQLDESDISILTRLAIQYDLVAKPTGGKLFVGKRSGSTRADGSPMPVIDLKPVDVSRWEMVRSLSEATGTVIATYRDIGSAEDIEVKEGKGDPVRRLRGRFRSEKEARDAARAEARRATRAKETFTCEMPGNPRIGAECRLIPINFSSAASGEWLTSTVTHRISAGGYLTSIEAERPDSD